MEIISKVVTALCFAIAVIIVSSIIVFSIITIKFKSLSFRYRKIQQSLTEEEIRLLKLSCLVHQAMALTNEYIADLIYKRKELQNKTTCCKDKSTNIDSNDNMLK